MPERLSLSTQLINQILAFLGAQPYQSVAGLIQAVHAEAQNQIRPTPTPTLDPESE